MILIDADCGTFCVENEKVLFYSLLRLFTILM